MSAALPGQSTIAVWGGETGHDAYERATQVPVVHSVSFGYADLDSWQAVALERAPGHIYSRISNPTVRAFEEKIRDLEAAQAATSFSSGMAAISATLFTFLRPGDRVALRQNKQGTPALIRALARWKNGAEELHPRSVQGPRGFAPPGHVA